MEKAALPPGAEASDRGRAAPTPRRTRPTQQGTVYLWTLGVFSVFLLGFKANLAFLLGAFALGCAGVAWLLARGNLGGLEIERLAPRRARAGRPVRFRWRVRNRGRSTRIGVEIEDRPARGTKPVRVVAEMPVVAPGAEVVADAAIAFQRRGEIDLSRQPLVVSSRYPLGLFRTEIRLPGEGVLLVRPREGRLTRGLRKRLRGRRLVETRSNLGRGEDVIYGVREYRAGDDPRRIHWRTTARRGTLTLTQWRAEQGREAVIVLGRGPGAGGPAAANFERAVAAAATLWRACVGERLCVTLELGDGRPLRSDGDGRGLERGLDALARVSAQGSRAPRRAMRRLAARDGRRAVVFVSAGKAARLEEEVQAAAGRGGDGFVIPAWSRRVARFVQGLGA